MTCGWTGVCRPVSSHGDKFVIIFLCKISPQVPLSMKYFEKICFVIFSIKIRCLFCFCGMLHLKLAMLI